MTIMHASHHTDVLTVNYSSLHTQRKLHHCVTDVKRQYPITPLFRGDLGMRRQWGIWKSRTRTADVDADADKIKMCVLLFPHEQDMNSCL